MSEKNERMAWSGQCDTCFALTIVVASEETAAEDVDRISNEWPETLPECLVVDCEGVIEWNGNDPVSSVLSGRML